MAPLIHVFVKRLAPYESTHAAGVSSGASIKNRYIVFHGAVKGAKSPARASFTIQKKGDGGEHRSEKWSNTPDDTYPNDAFILLYSLTNFRKLDNIAAHLCGDRFF